MGTLGVFPVFDIIFRISPIGKVTDSSGMVTIAEMETFEVSIDGNVEEWTPMNMSGWARRLATGKSFAIALSGKRNDTDEGNNYIAGLAYKTGRDCSTSAEIIFPDGSTLFFDCVVNVTKDFGGASTDVSALEFDLMSDGAPVYTASGTTVTLESAVQAGGTSGSGDSTGIVLTFDTDVAGLLASHITLASGTGSAAKGALSGAGKVWTLAIDAPVQGTVKVFVGGLTGYSFLQQPKTVTIFSA